MLDRMLACQQKCKTRAVSLTNHPWENLLRCTETYCAVRQSPRRPREPFSSGRRCKPRYTASSAATTAGEHYPSACLITSVRWLASVGSSTVVGWWALACCPAVARLLPFSSAAACSGEGGTAACLIMTNQKYKAMA